MRSGIKSRKVVARLRALRNPAAVAGMAHFGIDVRHALGISMPVLRKMARDIGRDHRVAQDLWATGIHEARILAALVADPTRATPALMDRWARDFRSWDVCDACCGNFFDRTPFAWDKALEWSKRKEEFVKRAGFALMAWLAVHDKSAPDQKFKRLFPAIERASTDERNFVRKAVNWALRQIGKRNAALRKSALQAAERIKRKDSKAARWIAADALRELRGRKT